VAAGDWSPFNTGLQLDVVLQSLIAGPVNLCARMGTRLGNGMTIFPGGVPLYRDGILIGAIGVSGDGVDQDEVVAAAGAKGFEPPAGIRVDTVLKGGAPYTK
jgi:hypothetical protein